MKDALKTLYDLDREVNGSGYAKPSVYAAMETLLQFGQSGLRDLIERLEEIDAWQTDMEQRLAKYEGATHDPA